MKDLKKLLPIVGILVSSMALAGPGGTLIISNQTSHTMAKAKENVYQMQTWNLPDQIPKKSTVKSYVEFGWGVTANVLDDKAVTVYSVDCHHKGKIDTITITGIVKAKDENTGPNISITTSGNSCIKVKEPANRDLGWKHDGTMQIVIADK